MRHLGKIFVLLALTGVVVAAYPNIKSAPGYAYLSGWILLGIIVILAGYNFWKKLPFLPLGMSEGWLQFHVYAGLFSAVIFFAHVRWRWPTGIFEQLFTLMYAAVMLSGIAGLIISRTFPRRLTARGGEVIYEQIPLIRSALRKSAETLALESIPEAGKSTIADFYSAELAGFFADRRNRLYHLFESRIPLNRLQAKIGELNRFLNEQERKRMARIADYVREKDGLDYHYSLQSTLKIWLFTHIPLSYGLLIFAALHVLLVTAFSGGAQ